MAITVPPPIETARLVVRPAQEADLPALLAVNADDEVTRFLPYASWRAMADAEAWWQRTRKAQDAGTAVQFVVALKGGGVIGSCLLFRHDEASRRAELGYVMGRPHWRGGFMSEALSGLLSTAFDGMGLRLVDAEVDPRNRPSVALLRRLGFRNEGLLRQRWVTKGEARDVEAFALLRHEWPPAPGVAPGIVVDRLDHLVLTVASIDASIDFYGRVLGMRAVRFGAGRVALEYGRQKINLHPASAPIAPHARAPLAGSADLCFIVDTPVDEAIAHLQREGVEVLQGPVMRTGALGPIRSVYFRDPDGNLVEVSNYGEG